MVFGPRHDYKVGDPAWIYVGDHGGNMSKGTVVAILDLPGYNFQNYVISLPTSMDELLEVRSSSSMRPSDPRLDAMVVLLVERTNLDLAAAREAAYELLEIAERWS